MLSDNCHSPCVYVSVSFSFFFSFSAPTARISSDFTLLCCTFVNDVYDAHTENAATEIMHMSSGFH